MQSYLAFLRGVNVGGKAMIKMADLQAALAAAGLENVKTYIQSGNVLFSSDQPGAKLAPLIKTVIKTSFKLDVDVAVFSKQAWLDVIKAAPKWWGVDPAWKHNLFIMIEPAEAALVSQAMGPLKDEIEKVEIGNGVVYQSVLFAKFGQTTTSKLIAHPLYKRMTIRNYNTSIKLGALLEASE